MTLPFCITSSTRGIFSDEYALTTRSVDDNDGSRAMMDDVSVQIDLGAVRSFTREQMDFRLVVKNNGVAQLQIYAYDLGNMRKSGVFLSLGESGYRELKAILEYAEVTLRRMNRPSSHDERTLRIAIDGEDVGDVSEGTVRFMLRHGKLSRNDYYFDPEQQQWRELGLDPAF